MKTLIIVGIIGLLAVAGFVLVSALQGDSDTSLDESSSQPNYRSCGGGCSAGQTCGNPSCGFEKTGTCGCRG